MSPLAIGSGLGAQIGIVKETIVNTPVAVTTFVEFTSETLERRPNIAQGRGLAAGLFVERSSRRIEVAHDAGGAIVFDVPNKGLGKWMQAMMGSAPTATQIAASTAYQQIHNLGSADGTSYTIQKGVPSVDGTGNPLTYSGCKVNDWDVSNGPNGLAILTLNIDAMDVVPTGAGAAGLQTASYTAANPLFSFKDLAVTTASAATNVSSVWTPTTPASVGVVRNFSIKGGQPKDNARWQAGSQVKAEALVNDFQPITGQLDIDFASMAQYTKFAANTSQVLQAKWTGADAGSGNLFTLQFTMPAAFLGTGSTPKVSGPGVVTVSYPFEAKDDGVLGALQVVIISTDTVV